MELIDIAKQKIKLVDHIKGNKKQVGNKVWVNPCPECGHKDHFTIYIESNTYYSQSGCCKGGSIVDYLVNVEHFEISKALSYVLELAGLKETNKKTASEIRKLKEERLKQEKIKQFRLSRSKALYHKLTESYKLFIKIPLDNRTAWVTWVIGFLDNYTNLIICNPNDYGLVEDFKKNYEYEFNNFLKWGKDFEKQYHTKEAKSL